MVVAAIATPRPDASNCFDSPHPTAYPSDTGNRRSARSTCSLRFSGRVGVVRGQARSAGEPRLVYVACSWSRG